MNNKKGKVIRAAIVSWFAFGGLVAFLSFIVYRIVMPALVQALPAMTFPPKDDYSRLIHYLVLGSVVVIVSYLLRATRLGRSVYQRFTKTTEDFVNLIMGK